MAELLTAYYPDYTGPDDDVAPAGPGFAGGPEASFDLSSGEFDSPDLVRGGVPPYRPDDDGLTTFTGIPVGGGNYWALDGGAEQITGGDDGSDSLRDAEQDSNKTFTALLAEYAARSGAAPGAQHHYAVDVGSQSSDDDEDVAERDEGVAERDEGAAEGDEDEGDGARAEAENNIFDYVVAPASPPHEGSQGEGEELTYEAAPSIFDLVVPREASEESPGPGSILDFVVATPAPQGEQDDAVLAPTLVPLAVGEEEAAGDWA